MPLEESLTVLRVVNIMVNNLNFFHNATTKHWKAAIGDEFIRIWLHSSPVILTLQQISGYIQFFNLYKTAWSGQFFGVSCACRGFYWPPPSWGERWCQAAPPGSARSAYCTLQSSFATPWGRLSIWGTAGWNNRQKLGKYGERFSTGSA